jgi:5-methyltetrahydrofolate corrinoid/iron sulfur protein methyltransferase
MIFIGERINTGFKDIKAAVQEKDPKAIHEWAKKQTEAGANYLDVNLGAISSKPEDMCWMVEQTQAAVDTPVCIDSNKPSIIKEALKAVKGKCLINSTTAVQEKLDELMPLAAEHKAAIIGVSMDEAGAPKNTDKRVENAGMIMAKAMEVGIPPEDVFLDPIVMPLKFMQEQAKEVLEAVRQFTLFSDPPPHITCGLSNSANGAKLKRLVSRTFLVMAIANGMDSAICDVMDRDLVNAAKAAELVMNKEIFADSFTKR